MDIEFQVPKSTYRLGDIIPVYVTIPVPETEQVTKHGMRLRNIMVELVRTTKVFSHHNQAYSEDSSSMSASASTSASDGAPSEYSNRPALASRGHERNQSRGSDDGLIRDNGSTTFKTTLTRSGASARFHSSRPVRIRLIVRASALPSSPAQAPTDLSSHSSGVFDCPITQHTTLHSVEFSLDIAVSFLHQRDGSGNPPVQESASVSIPITLLPPVAKKPRVGEEGDMERDYHKKFDKPPVQTNREAEADVGPPGPSASGAPPPFDERDAPPPPFVQSDPQSMQAGSSRLPTFLESEAHYVVPLPGPSNSSQLPYASYTAAETSLAEVPRLTNEDDPDQILEIEGEGRFFGFRPEEQFDGLESSFGSGAEPPPAIEDVQADTDVTALADLVDQPERALEAIGRGMGVASAVDQAYTNQREADLDRLEHALHLDEVGAPAPPFMDDPADPPPGIDMEFRTSPPPFPNQRVDNELHTPPLPVDLPPSIEGEILPPPITAEGIVNPSTRPPPYLNPAAPTEGQHGPPPYVDLRPADA
jgi:neural Wiskott-Aldrich syndrome protein